MIHVVEQELEAGTGVIDCCEAHTSPQQPTDAGVPMHVYLSSSTDPQEALAISQSAAFREAFEAVIPGATITASTLGTAVVAAPPPSPPPPPLSPPTAPPPSRPPALPPKSPILKLAFPPPSLPLQEDNANIRGSDDDSVDGALVGSLVAFILLLCCGAGIVAFIFREKLRARFTRNKGEGPIAPPVVANGDVSQSHKNPAYYLKHSRIIPKVPIQVFGVSEAYPKFSRSTHESAE